MNGYETMYSPGMPFWASRLVRLGSMLTGCFERRWCLRMVEAGGQDIFMRLRNSI